MLYSAAAVVDEEDGVKNVRGRVCERVVSDEVYEKAELELGGAE